MIRRRVNLVSSVVLLAGALLWLMVLTPIVLFMGNQAR